MNKLKFLTIVSCALLIANLALVCFILFNRPLHPLGEGPRNEIIQKLKFDEGQVREYDKLIQSHRTEIKKSELEIMTVKNQLYSNLNSDLNGSIKDSLIRQLCTIQMNIENIHYKHFLDIKNICRDNQKQAFEKLTTEIASLFGHPPIKGEKK